MRVHYWQTQLATHTMTRYIVSQKFQTRRGKAMAWLTWRRGREQTPDVASHPYRIYRSYGRQTVVQIGTASLKTTPHLASLFTTTTGVAELMSSVRRKSLDLMLTTARATQAIATSSLRDQARSQVRGTLTIRYRAKSLARKRGQSIQIRKNPSKWKTGKSRWTRRKSANVSRISNVFCFELEN